MLDLNSDMWKKLGGPSGDGRLAAKLLGEAIEEGSTDWGELLNQICHQESLYSSAYAALPYLLKISKSGKEEAKFWSVIAIGVVASRRFLAGAETKPDFLVIDEEKLFSEALEVAINILSSPSVSGEDLMYLLGAVAALKSDPSLCFHIEGARSSIGCPNCDEVIDMETCELNLIESIGRVA